MIEYPARDLYTSDQEKIEKFRNLTAYKFKIKKIIDKIPIIKSINLPKLDYLFMGMAVYLPYKEEDYTNINILSDYFIDSCRKTCRFKNAPTPEEYFQEHNQEIINDLNKKNIEITPQNMRNELYGKVAICSSHNPCIIKYFIKTFRSKSVLDFSAGWGDRLLGAMASGIDKYTGVDPNSCLHPKYQEMISLLKPISPNPHIEIEMVQEKFENYQPTGLYDLVYTSPPYFDYEIYTKETTQSIHDKPTEEIWYEQFLQLSIIKSLNVLTNGGYLVLYISQESGRTYVEKMLNWMKNLSNVYYLGNICYSDTKLKHIHPIFIFKKSTKPPKILYNPLPYIQPIRMFDKKFFIIRDDFIIGGTKARAAIPYFQQALNHNNAIKRVIQIGAPNGYGQVACAYALYLLKRPDIILELRQTPMDLKEVEQIHKLIKIYHPNTVFIIKNERISQMYESIKDATPDTYVVPFGLGDKSFSNLLQRNLSFYLKNLPIIERLWLAGGSGTLMRVFRKLFPETKLLVVQVGREVDITGLSNIILYKSSKYMNQEYQIKLPYHTVKSYDAKVWEFIEKDGLDGDYVWNVAGSHVYV